MPFTINVAHGMTGNGSVNRGSDGSFTTQAKQAGNLPIDGGTGPAMLNTTGSCASGCSSRLIFGFTAQCSTGGIDASTDTRLLLYSFQYNAPNRVQITTMACNGTDFTLYSGTCNTNFNRWLIGGNDTPLGSSRDGSFTLAVDLDAPCVASTGGCFANCDVSGFAFGTVRFNIKGTTTNMTFYSKLHILETTKDATDIPKFTGTSDWSTAYDEVSGTSFSTRIGAWMVQIGTAYFVPIPFQIGDGTTETDFNDQGAIIVSPENNAALAETFRFGVQAMRVYYSMPNASSSANIMTGTYNWGTAAPWNFDESNDSTMNIAGASFNGMGDFTVGSSISGAATFTLAAGSDVIVNGADLDGSTINGDMILNSDTDLTGIHITGDLRCNITSNATIILTDCIIDGSIFNDAGSNTLTVTSITSTATAGDAGTGNGQTNLVATVTITVNVTRKDDGTDISGASVYVIRDSDGGEIVSGTTNGSGVFSDTYSYVGDEAVTVRVRKSTLPIPRFFARKAGNTVSNIGFTQNIQLVQDLFAAQI
jgi:hypothetical protein